MKRIPAYIIIFFYLPVYTPVAAAVQLYDKDAIIVSIPDILHTQGIFYLFHLQELTVLAFFVFLLCQASG